MNKDELKYRASLNAVDRQYGWLKIAIPCAILGWPVAMSIGGVGAVAGLGLLGIGAIFSAYKRAQEDWDLIEKDDRSTLLALTPKQHRSDLYKAYSETPTPNTLPLQALTLRNESHLLLIGPTRSGKTSALAALIGDSDCIYITLKRDTVPAAWKTYRIDTHTVNEDVEQVLDIVEPITSALLRGERTGKLWFCVDEILGIIGLCSKPVGDRLLGQVKLRLTAGAADGAYVGLLMQSPNGSDLGVSAAILRNFQAVVMGSQQSGFSHLAQWSERFGAISPETKGAIAALKTGYWAISDGALRQPPIYQGPLAPVASISPQHLTNTQTTPPQQPTTAAPKNPTNTAPPPPQHPTNTAPPPKPHPHNTPPPHRTNTPPTPPQQPTILKCPKCHSGDIIAHGSTTAGTPRWRCKPCGKVWSESPNNLTHP